GQIGGAPSTDTKLITATITAQSLLSTVDELKNILIKVNEDGSQIPLQDVAKVELVTESFSVAPLFYWQGT
ncbi:hypothetical protein V6255_18845, partial [Psychromonas arctica]